MRALLITCIWSVVFLATSPLQAQHQFAAEPDRATVYIVRSSAIGAALNFKYFVDDQFIGKSNYGKYLKVTLDPGEYLFWAKSENIDYLEATLAAGQTYIINAMPKAGMIKSGVRLVPVSRALGKKADRAVRALLKHEEATWTDEALAEEATKWTDLITRSLANYEKTNTEKKGTERLDTAMDLSALVVRKQ